MNRPPTKGRGAGSNPAPRYLRHHVEVVDDGWGQEDETPPVLHTELSVDASRSVITYNDSPDVGFDRSINPYRGCEHGCVYCYARPSHAWLDLSPGLDFETRLFHKPNAPELLRAELAHPRYRVAPVAVGSNTDAYQPVERRLQLTRRIIEILAHAKHPLVIVTKSSLVERDLDLLAPMAELNLVRVMVSVTTLDRSLARRMEPRATAPQRRLQTIQTCADAGVSVGVLVAPVIPMLTDPELEKILEACRNAGAESAGYVLLRLPLEVQELFTQWLHTHVPGQAQRVLSRIRETRNGNLNDGRFGRRMRGIGDYAAMIRQRFRLACKHFGYRDVPPLDTNRFQPPRVEVPEEPQLQLL